MYLHWILSHSIMLMKFIHTVVCIRGLFLFIVEQYSMVQIPLFVYSFFCWWSLELFPFWGIMNKFAVSTLVKIFSWVCVFISLICISGSRIAKSISRSMFNEIRNCQNFSQRCCIIVHSHQKCMNNLPATHPCQYLLRPMYLILVIFMGVFWHLVLICISLMTNDVEPFFIC